MPWSGRRAAPRRGCGSQRAPRLTPGGKPFPGPAAARAGSSAPAAAILRQKILQNTTPSWLLSVGVFRLRLTGYPRAGSPGCKASGTSDLFPLYMWPFSSVKQTTPRSAGSQRGVIHLFLLSQSVPKGSKESPGLCRLNPSPCKSGKIPSIHPIPAVRGSPSK